MKKLLVFLSLIFLVIGAKSVTFAVGEATTSGNATQSAVKITPVEKKAQDLLDRVATKVAALVDANKRTYHGTIKSVGTNSYTLTTNEGDRMVITNDATDFYRIKGGKSSNTDFAGIKSGEDISAVGTIDPNNQSMTAKQVITKIKRTIFAGPIESIDKTIVVISGNKIDLSDASYEQMDSDGKISIAKISDFSEGKTAFILAHSPDAKTGIYSSLKALVVND